MMMRTMVAVGPMDVDSFTVIFRLSLVFLRMEGLALIFCAHLINLLSSGIAEAQISGKYVFTS